LVSGLRDSLYSIASRGASVNEFERSSGGQSDYLEAVSRRKQKQTNRFQMVCSAPK